MKDVKMRWIFEKVSLIIEFCWQICVYIAHSNCVFSPLYLHSALDILLCIWGFMPPAISPTSLSCAYRKQCRVRMTSTCTSCSTRSLQACRFTPRLAQMASAVSPLHTFIYYFYSLQFESNLIMFANQVVYLREIGGWVPAGAAFPFVWSSLKVSDLLLYCFFLLKWVLTTTIKSVKTNESVKSFRSEAVNL